MEFAFLSNLFVTYPWLGPAVIILYGISEIVGNIDGVKENSVYQMVKTAINKVFTSVTTPK